MGVYVLLTCTLRTFKGSGDPSTNERIVAASTTPGTNNTSAPASAYTFARSIVPERSPNR